MAAPLLAGIGGAVAAALATKAGYILAGMGLMLAAYFGLSQLSLALISSLNGFFADATNVSTSFAGSVIPIGRYVVDFAALCGLFEAVNIIFAGVLTRAALRQLQVVLQRAPA